jgi:nicotinate-nucleotide pyrophosphorylase (carboxylating)
MYHEHIELWKNLLVKGLKDDGYPWDWTTLGTRRKQRPRIQAKVIAKSEGVWAGEGLVHALRAIAPSLRSESLIPDGKRYREKTILATLSGSADDVLALERPFLNLAAYASGVASATYRYVEIVKKACPKNPPRITLTRKTLPGYRDIAIHGVRVGGGHPHRVSLSGGVLIKENHIAAAGGIRSAIQGVKVIAPHGLKVEIEVTSLQELKEAVKAGAEGILLDNFTPKEVAQAIRVLAELCSGAYRPFIEVSGGVNESTVAEYAIPGVDIISVGALTHSVKAVDLSLLVSRT